MKKKAYMTPGFKEVSLEIEELLGFTVSASGEGIQSDETPDTGTGDNRSRHYNVWDEE